MGRKSRARRVLGVIGAVVGTTVTFVAAIAASAVVHLDTAATRRVVAAQVNGILHDQFAGDVAVERIGGLSLRGVAGVRVRVKDPSGMQVLFVDGALVRIRALETARSALFGEGDIMVAVDLVSLGHVDAAIDGDAAGNLRIANAFAERTPTPPTPKDPNARGVRVDAPAINLASAWVHGAAPGAPPLDAEIHDLVGHAHYDAKLTSAVLDRVDLVTRGLPRGVDPRGRIGGRFTMPSVTGKDMGVEAAFDGVIAGVSTTARAQLNGQRVDAVVDGRDPAGQGVRSTFGEVAIQEEITLHAEAHGELPRIAAKAHVAVGRGTVDVDGHVDMSEGTKADATIAMRHVDLHGIVSAAPASDVGLDTRVNVLLAKSGAVNGEIVLDTLPGTVAGEALPILKMSGRFTKDSAHADGRIFDPRATADFAVDLTTVGDDRIVEGRIHADVPDLSRAPRAPATVKGHATLDANGTVNLGTRALSVSAHVVAGGLAYDANKVDNATVLATAHGTIDQPIVDVGVHAGGISAGEQKIGVADVRGQIEPGAVTTIRDAHVDMVREGQTLSAYAKRVQIGGPRVNVEGAVVTGLGEPLLADFSRDPNEIRIKLDAPSLDLAGLARLAGKPNAVKRGHLAIKGDLALRREGATGDLHAKVTALSTEQIQNATVALDARVEGRKVDLGVKAELAEAGTFELATRNVAVPGNPADPEAWKRAHGSARFAANVDLKKVATLVPEGSLPLSELGGRLVVAGTLRRDSADVLPEMSVHAHTRGLVIAGKATPEPDHDVAHGQKVKGVQPWRSQGVDASADVRFDATSGFGEVAFHAVDSKGTLIGFDAKSDLPYAEIAAHPAQAIALLERTPVRARLVVPKRALADMPALAGTRSMPGTVEAEIDFSGTALRPEIAFVAHARGVRSPSLPAKLAADADVRIGYDGEKVELVATAGVEDRRALDVGARVDIRASDLLEPKPGQALAWEGSARVKLASFPIESIGGAADRRIRGRVSGEASLVDLHKDAKLTAHLGLEDLKVGRAAYKSGSIDLVTHDGKVTLGARLDQTDGFADLQATTGLAWGEALVPAMDPTANTEGHLEAKGFRAAAILPFVQPQLNALDGRIDANATVKLGPGFKDPTMEGKVAFHDGTLQLAAIGEEYKNARATVTFQPGGAIKIDDVYMIGTEGVLMADALVKTRGLGLDSATANLHIPKRKPLDLAVQGQPLGAISGDVKLAATNSEDGKTIRIDVDVPTLDLALPQKIKSGVQDLSEKEDIRVGVFREPKTFVKLPLDKEDLEPPVAEQPVGTVLEVDVKLGAVTIVQGNAMRVVLTGAPHIKVTNKTEVTGQIVLEEGKIEVQGKAFEIEKGTVTFQPGDASNPIVVATAEWTADDGTHVYADFVGPVKTGKVTLRSDPQRPRNEVLAIILFGTADGSTGSPAPRSNSDDGKMKAAVGVGGGFAAQGLTEAMDDLTGVQATAKIDTTRSTNPAPEIEIQLARRLSVSFLHILGTPPISQPDTNLATVDWRFRANWSLETTFGNKGLLQADAVWQKRY